MTRGGKRDQEVKEIYDDNGIAHTTTRSLKKVNYAEIENGYDSQPESASSDEKEMLNQSTRLARNSPRKKRVLNEDYDDESFHDEEEEEEEDDEVEPEDDDDYIDEEGKKRARTNRERSFVVKDDEDVSDENEEYTAKDDDDEEDEEEEDEDVVSGRRRGRKRTRMSDSQPDVPIRQLRTGRSRITRSSHNEEYEHRKDDALTLEDEIRELQEDSPIREKRSLRERTKPVNYTLPPPLTDNQIDGSSANIPGTFSNMLPYQGSTFQSPKGKRGLHSGQSFGPIRRLFPTGGPFGGNDVTSIFGQNVQFYNSNSNGNDLQNKFLDSDSSDDEILALGMKPKPKDPTKRPKKKKQEIADLDPLGVDMNVSFDEIGGLDNYIDQLKEMVALPLLYPELYLNFNITPPRGVLFHGPPGTGKTLMARALAASCSNEKRKITFFMRKGADILSKWVGEAERQLRLLFEEAKKHQPSIIFFDEIDGLAPVRSSKQEQIHASIVSTMLALMDGMDNRGQIIVIGATNRPDAVDPALRRPGRFDREFYFPLPDVKGREKILQIHTKKWNPSLSSELIAKLAVLTKGYGGADLRALCTEASLISIQRKFPQIYKSEQKLKVDPKSVRVKAKDFILALEKILPSSARSSSSTPQGLSKTLEKLLGEQFEHVKDNLERILPIRNQLLKSGSSVIQFYMENEDVEDSDTNESAGLEKHEFLEQIKKSRIYKPKLLITGQGGNGLQYITSSVLNFLEGYNIQMLDIPTLLSDSARTMESTLVQIVTEAKKRQPSVLCITNLELWVEAIPHTCVLTLATLLRSIQTSDNVVLLAIGDGIEDADLSDGPLSLFSFDENVIRIRAPSSKQRQKYFETLSDILRMRPIDFMEHKKRSSPIEQLPIVESEPVELDDEGNILNEDAKIKRDLIKFQHEDMRLKNTLKIKLSGLMDLFKNRYKRFRKPPIDDSFLVHLFEPEAFATNQSWQPAYIKDEGMILEIATGRKFYNMDLDIIEERLWNGFYSEPKQFLKDIELIYADAVTSADRERVIKASEMFANAQIGIEEISQPDFIAQCKATRKRDLLRRQFSLKAEQDHVEKEQEELLDKTPNTDPIPDATEVTTSSGNQIQSQLQIDLDVEESPKISNELVSEHSPIRAESDIEPSTAQSALGTTDPNECSITKVDIQKAPSIDLAENNSEAKYDQALTNDKRCCTFILDETRVSLIISQLSEKTSGFTVDKLEKCYSEITNIIWKHREVWNKNTTIDELQHFVEEL